MMKCSKSSSPILPGDIIEEFSQRWVVVIEVCNQLAGDGVWSGLIKPINPTPKSPFAGPSPLSTEIFLTKTNLREEYQHAYTRETEA